jgi:hypothetical protein
MLRQLFDLVSQKSGDNDRSHTRERLGAPQLELLEHRRSLTVQNRGSNTDQQRFPPFEEIIVVA